MRELLSMIVARGVTSKVHGRAYEESVLTKLAQTRHASMYLRRLASASKAD